MSVLSPVIGERGSGSWAATGSPNRYRRVPKFDEVEINARPRIRASVISVWRMAIDCTAIPPSE
jgi:hypothetical protein